MQGVAGVYTREGATDGLQEMLLNPEAIRISADGIVRVDADVIGSYVRTFSVGDW
jgi:hypothetical protein